MVEFSIDEDPSSFLIILKSEIPNGFICYLNTSIVLSVIEKGCGPLTAGDDHIVKKSKEKNAVLNLSLT
jgi:hypothetical protein